MILTMELFTQLIPEARPNKNPVAEREKHGSIESNRAMKHFR